MGGCTTRQSVTTTGPPDDSRPRHVPEIQKGALKSGRVANRKTTWTGGNGSAYTGRQWTSVPSRVYVVTRQTTV